MSSTLGPGASRRRSWRPSGRADQGKLLAALIIIAVVVVFAVLNLTHVRVHYVFGSGRTPLIIVIAITFLCGMAVDRLIALRRRRSSR